MNRKAFFSTAGFVLVLMFFCNTYYHELLHMWPWGIHDWAQADRLSLAISFYDNGMNFFKPTTHNLYSTNGITGVEFPIQSYIAALGGKLLGRDHISAIFRLLDTIIGCIGMGFLFLAGYKATPDFAASLVAPLFMFCSPIYIYYTCNYLPDAAACSIAFVSFYFIINYLDKPANKQLVVAIALLTLASLIKTSVALYLLGFIGFVFLERVRHYRGYSLRANSIYIISSFCSLATLAGYYLYNQHLNKKYHSDLFLSKANPFKDMDAVSYYLNANFKYVWVKEYFVLPQYLLMAAIIGGAIPLLLKSTTGKRKLRLLLIFLLGTLCVGYLMGGQLFNHDYYVVSIFLPLFAFAVLISATELFNSITLKTGRQSLRIALIASILICFFFADFHIHERLKPGYIGFSSTEPPWYLKGESILNQHNISKDEHILVLNEEAPNTALVYFNRRGYHIPGAKMQGAEKWLPDFMKQLRVTTVVAEAGYGGLIMGKDTTHFSEVSLQDHIAVYKLK